MKYSAADLTSKLSSTGWRTVIGNQPTPLQGTLHEMAEAAHARHKNGHAVGHLQEIETEIEVDMFQLLDLWRHLGLPTL